MRDSETTQPNWYLLRETHTSVQMQQKVGCAQGGDLKVGAGVVTCPTWKEFSALQLLLKARADLTCAQAAQSWEHT